MCPLRFGFRITPAAQPVRAVPFNLRYKISLLWLAQVVAAWACVTVEAQSRPSVIVDAVDAARPALLANHHPLWANAANDLGALTPQDPVGQMTLVLARSAAQQAALEQLLADQQNSASPVYHHWLTPQEMGDRFGTYPTNAEYLDALEDAFMAAGYSPQQAEWLAEQAAAQQAEYGLLPSDLVPRIPGPINQVSPN